MAALKWAGLSMIALSLVTGVLAVRSASTPDAEEQKPPTRPVVVARRAIPADREIAGSDIEVVLAHARPSDGFVAPELLVGRVSARDIEPGEPLRERALFPQSALVRALRPGETAVAVEVDGVTGLGGFARPGDAVDVLFLLRRDGREVAQTQARTLLRGARLLTFGTRLEPADPGEPTLNARTAVLAVREADAPRLLLADVVGTLRLALRASDRDEAPAKTASITLKELLEIEKAAPKPRATPKPPPKRGIPVIRGGEAR